VRFSSEGRKKLAEFSGYVYYGSDENVTAFLGVVGIREAGLRLLVVDRKSSAIIADKNLPKPEGLFPEETKSLIVDWLTVRSKDSSVYFDTFHNGFGIGEANWKTEKVRQFPFAPPEGKLAELFLVSYPPGLFVEAFTGTTRVLYDTGTQKKVFARPDPQDSETWQRSFRYFVPTIGLMEYAHGEHLQLTDTNLSMPVANPLRFPSAVIITRIYARVLDGKPYLIWGEYDPPIPHPREQATISEVVIFDPALKKEALRKPLGAGMSRSFQPNQTGTRIYFLKPENMEIFCFDRPSQTISSFAKTGIKHGLYIVDGN
jgi:hypothetical protein